MLANALSNKYFLKRSALLDELTAWYFLYAWATYDVTKYTTTVTSHLLCHVLATIERVFQHYVLWAFLEPCLPRQRVKKELHSRRRAQHQHWKWTSKKTGWRWLWRRRQPILSVGEWWPSPQWDAWADWNCAEVDDWAWIQHCTEKKRAQVYGGIIQIFLRLWRHTTNLHLYLLMITVKLTVLLSFNLLW